MSVKITQFEAENVKRIKALTLTPAPAGLTVIGGRNNQGKTSGLDAIVWALGGDRYRPSQAQREGSVLPPRLRLELSNGIIVERSGKNSDLKVTDASGRKAGQQLLNSFVEQLALDMPRFMQSTSKEKATTPSALSVWRSRWKSWSGRRRSCITSGTLSARSPTKRRSTSKSSPAIPRPPPNRFPPMTSFSASRTSLPGTAKTSASGRGRLSWRRKWIG